MSAELYVWLLAIWLTLMFLSALLWSIGNSILEIRNFLFREDKNKEQP